MLVPMLVLVLRSMLELELELGSCAALLQRDVE